MRQIFSVRFFFAVGAVVGLFFVLTTIFQIGSLFNGSDGASGGTVNLHRIDLIGQMVSIDNAAFTVSEEGVAVNDARIALDPSRALSVIAGTPGVNLCPAFPTPASCAIVVDLLGEAVVWFALVPMGLRLTVPLPAIDTLDGDLATLVNGWQMTFAPELIRRCEAYEFGSYREVRDALGDNFTSIYDIEQRRITAVDCGTRVAFAPVASTVP